MFANCKLSRSSSPGVIKLLVKSLHSSGRGLRGVLRSVRGGSMPVYALALVPASFLSFSDSQEHTVVIPMATQHSNFAGEGSNPQTMTVQQEVPSFDPSLGTLTRVEFELQHSASLLYKYESMKDNGLQHMMYLHDAIDQLDLTLPGSELPLVSSTGSWSEVLRVAPPFDGLLDLSDIPVVGRLRFNQSPISVSFTAPEVLEHFTGEGTSKVRLSANSVFKLDSRSMMYIYFVQIKTGGSLRVTYHYAVTPR